MLGIATSTVRAKAREGIFVRSSRGRFDARQSLINYIDQLRAVTGRVSEQADELKAQKVRVANGQAEKLEIQNAAARRELLPAAEVEREWASVLRDVRAGILAAPSRIGSRLAHLTAHDVTEIARELSAVLSELGEGAPHVD